MEASNPVSNRRGRAVSFSFGVSGSEGLSEYNIEAESNSTSDEVHSALSSGSAGNPIISIAQPATIDSILEQHTEHLPASPVIQPSQGSYSYLNSDISDYLHDEWVLPSPSDIDSSAEEHDQNEHQLSNDWRNESNHERRLEIEESFEELVAPSHLLPAPYTSVSNIHHVRVATAPFRGRGVPVLETARASNIHREPSEISDLGQRMYYEGRIRDSRFQNASVSGESKILARPRKSLQDRLFEALQRKNSTTPLAKGFFPATALSTIITFKTVKEELRKQHCLDNYDLDKISQFARMICTEKPCKTSNDNETGKVQSFRKVFAILVMLDKVPAIVKFLETNVNDSDLPLKAFYRRHGGIYDLRRRKAPRVRLMCFPERWGCLLLSQFEEMQWTTLAPYFGKARSSTDNGVLHYRLPDKAILPFLGDDEEGPNEEYEFAGGGGRVFKVKIHADHHTFHRRLCPWTTATPDAITANGPTTALPRTYDDCACQFAIKKLHSRDKALFLKEVDVLKKFSNERHPHLISLLATYEQSQSFYLVFPWAEASLDGYWRFKNPSPNLDNDTVRWVAKQCHGIAHGVSAIHKYESFELSPSQGDRYGHHGDIKPENILWFPDRNESPTGSSVFEGGTLQLTDFGLAAISTKRTMSRIRGTIMVSRCYCAPEIDLPDGGGHGRQYDMWTLGCLYVEFVTWLIGGWRLLSEFNHARSAVDQAWCSFKTDTFFTIKENLNSPDREKEAIVKPQVTEFIEELHANPKCTEFLHELLDMVQSGLLIVKKSNGEQLERLSSQQVCGKLNDMLRKCLESDSYGCKPCPREKSNVS